MHRKFSYLLVSLSTILVALLLAGAMLGSSTKSDGQEPYRHLQVFTEVLSKIKSEYVEEPNMSSIAQGAINGLLESVDPYASYLNAEQYKEFQAKSRTQQGNVGLGIARRYGYVGIVSVLPGSSAARKNLTTGDIIDSINNISTRDMPLAYAELMLQGKPGSAVELTVLRARKPEPETLTLVREIPKPLEVRAEILDGKTGYIHPYTLTEGKVKEVAQALKDLEKKGADKLVLDLRNVAVGDPDAGVALADLFMKTGTIAHIEGQRYPKVEKKASEEPSDFTAPLIVLVNRGTAGAAEVAAAAIQSNARAGIVGERTYGHAGIQREIRMDDGGAVFLSVAKYYGPDGKAIQDTAIIPGEAVSPYPQIGTEEEQELYQPPVLAPNQPLQPVDDLQLKKALELVKIKAEAGPAKAA